MLGYGANQFIGRAHVLRGGHQLLFAQRCQPLHFIHQRAHVAHSFYNVAAAGFALGADHCCTFPDTPERLTQVGRATNKRGLEVVLVDMVGFVRRCQDFGFIDEIDFKGLQDLGLGKVADSAFRHYRDRHRVLDLLNHIGIRHARDAAIPAYIGRYALERHYRTGPGIFRDFGLFSRRDVHDRTALQHLGEAYFDGKCVLFDIGNVIHSCWILLRTRVSMRAFMLMSQAMLNEESSPA